MKKTPFLLGTYILGYESVDLWVERIVSNSWTGGAWFQEFPNNPPEHKNGEIHLTLDTADQWHIVLHVLMHEAFEYACIRLQLRYASTSNFTRSAGRYQFIMNHEAMDLALAMATEFVCGVWVDLQPIYDDARKPKTKPKRKRTVKSPPKGSKLSGEAIHEAILKVHTEEE